MYSDEEIRQAMFDMADDNWNRAVVDKTKDTRFPTVALEMLKESDDKAIEAALYTLFYTTEFHSSIDVSQILPFLDSPLHWTNAIRLLKRIGDASLLPRLMPFLIYPDLEARVEALRAIYVLGHSQTLEICLSFINDTDASMRALVCIILGELKNPMAVEALIDKLQDNEIDGDWCVSASAARALAEIKDKHAIEPLKNAVKYGDSEVSGDALSALWAIAGHSLEPFYLEQLTHPYEDTRIATLWIIGQLSKADYIDLLISISQNDSSYDVQSAAARALLFIGTKEALDAHTHWHKHYKRKP